MVRYLNPGGFNFGSKNLDGYGISLLAVALAYTVMLYWASIHLWLHRHHHIVKMRNIPLLLSSLHLIHVYAFMAMAVYFLNGGFPCTVEYWSMNLYLPIGIGLWQAQNQKLLVVSRQQTQLSENKQRHRLLPPKSGHGIGGPKYWYWRIKLWWKENSEDGNYQAYIPIAVIVQLICSLVIYNLSRKFNHYGIVEKHVSPMQCRRGWEWAPSVAWQCIYFWIFAPYLVFQIRKVRDIYHWRDQTILAIIAALPGTPLWLTAVYSDKLAPVNKYWIPAMWFVPGVFTMQVAGIGFPIYQLWKHRRAARRITRTLAEFNTKRFSSFNASMISDTVNSSSTASARGRMHPMESLDECLAGNYEGFLTYASTKEFCGENIVFLTRVLAFKKTCQYAFRGTFFRPTSEHRRARDDMFHDGLRIFLDLIHSGTANYPINIESSIYQHLDRVFGPATAKVATPSSSRSTSFSTETSSVTPWDEPADNDGLILFGKGNPFPEHAFPMQSMASHGHSRSSSARIQGKIKGNESAEHIFPYGISKKIDTSILASTKAPTDFDEKVFDAAFQSVRYMVWTETWQRYQNYNRAFRKPSLESGLNQE